MSRIDITDAYNKLASMWHGLRISVSSNGRCVPQREGLGPERGSGKDMEHFTLLCTSLFTLVCSCLPSISELGIQQSMGPR